MRKVVPEEAQVWACYNLTFSSVQPTHEAHNLKFRNELIDVHNYIPSKEFVSPDTRKAGIVGRNITPDLYRKRIPFEAYVMVYTTAITKMISRSTPCITLGESN